MLERVLALATAAAGLLLASPAFAVPVALPTQSLDTIVAYSDTTALDLAFTSPGAVDPFTNLGTTGSAFATCTLTAANGLYCLDGKNVRNWPVPANPATSSLLFACDNAAFGFGANGCSAMTVGAAGAVFVAGKRGATFSIFQVVQGACAAGFSPLGNGWCAKELYGGRQSVMALSTIEGDIAAGFRPCAGCAPASGLVGIEEGHIVKFYPVAGIGGTGSILILGNTGDLGLALGEDLQDVALLQTRTPAGSVVNTLLATTVTGRLIAKNTENAATASTVFSLVGARAGTSSCSVAPARFSVRASPATGLVYAADSATCRVYELKQSVAPTPVLPLQLAQSKVLSTSVPGLGTYPPRGLTLAPGYGFDLSRCAIRCVIVNDANGNPAAELSEVKLVAGAPTGAWLFQVKGLPDCRYANDPAFGAADRDLCFATPKVVAGPNGVPVDLAIGLASFPPEALFLNATPLIPANAASQFPGGTLPPLLVSREYRGKASKAFVFEALFVLTQPGVRFLDTFRGEFKVDALETGLPIAGYDRCRIAGGYTPLATLLKWDVASTVSEVFVSIDNRYVDTLWNTGCGSILISGARLSLLPYNLEITPKVYDASTHLAAADPAVFAVLFRKLYIDLGAAQQQLACTRVDPVVPGVANNTAPPLPANVCSSLAKSWDTGLPKVDKCIAAAFRPKQSGGDENCKAFEAAIKNFEKVLPDHTPANDGANRLGELRMRIEVIRHVYETRFLPSIPPNGFGG